MQAGCGGGRQGGRVWERSGEPEGCVRRWSFREREKFRVFREILFMLYSVQAFIMSPRTIQWR